MMIVCERVVKRNQAMKYSLPTRRIWNIEPRRREGHEGRVKKKYNDLLTGRE
jgi:hypothetical protein